MNRLKTEAITSQFKVAKAMITFPTSAQIFYLNTAAATIQSADFVLSMRCKLQAER
ncbi:MAG: hypothetical protein IJK81_09055 [Selenomonadaceae bacterium]|nr:hypothetical protein [Selenomonadaceae bacterium]